MGEKLQQVLRAIEVHHEQLVAVLIHLNDTYLIEERPELELPGFARVISTANLIRAHVTRVLGKDRTLVLHSGDFMGPSRVGRRTKGKTMVELLNRLGLDWCVVGNHEFDYGEDVLIERMKEARFGVVAANVTTGALKVLPWIAWPSASQPLVAISGIVSKTVHGSFPTGWTFQEPWAALSEFSVQTRSIPFHVILTHATRLEDRGFRQGLPSRTILLGGHDHDIRHVEDDGSLIMKNYSNLKTIRVVLLLAGGGEASLQFLQAADELHDRRFKELKVGDLEDLITTGIDPYIPKFPDHAEAALALIHPVDAAVFRRDWASVISPNNARSHSLESAIHGLPSRHDFLQFVLTRDDHEPSDKNALELINTAITLVPQEDELVLDASSQVPGGFDAREEALRHGPNEFGGFVAECVRRATQADVAILNGGSFRCDSMLPARLRVRDALDCFLYDDEDSIVVLELPRTAAQALLDHGRSQRGGGCAQVAIANEGLGEPTRVAIVRYLVMNPKTIDGYDCVLAASLGCSVSKLADRVRELERHTTSIVRAVREHGSTTTVPSLSRTFSSTRVDEFIRLADALLDAAVAARVRDLEEFGLDDEHRDKQFLLARNELRLWIRRLPEVTNAEESLYKWEAGGPVEDDSLREAMRQSLECLRKLRRELETHRLRFERNRHYHKVLDYSANKIGGWIA